MSASPRKTTQWLLICGTPLKTSAHTPQRTKRAPTHRCTVTVWCSGALCSVLVQPTVREPRALCWCGCSARTLCPDSPRCALFLVQVRFTAVQKRHEALEQDGLGACGLCPRHCMGCRFCCYSLWGPDFLIACYCATVDIPFPKSRCTPYEQQRLMLWC